MINISIRCDETGKRTQCGAIRTFPHHDQTPDSIRQIAAREGWAISRSDDEHDFCPLHAKPPPRITRRPKPTTQLVGAHEPPLFE